MHWREAAEKIESGVAAQPDPLRQRQVVDQRTEEVAGQRSGRPRARTIGAVQAQQHVAQPQHLSDASLIAELGHVEAERRKKLSSAGAEMARAVDAKVQRPFAVKAAR